MTFPLGSPVNRSKDVVWVEIKGRPRWFRHLLTGEEKYIEPETLKKTEPPDVDILCAREE